MSKELTEQWRNGTLPAGYYYVVDVEGVKDLDDFNGENFSLLEVKEVLAPVPSYSEYQSLKDNCDFTHICLKGARQKITQLEKKLDIATKALKKIDPKNIPFKDFHHRGTIFWDIARRALKETEEL